MNRPPINPDTGKLSKRGEVVFEVWNWSLEDFQEQVRNMSNSELRVERETWYFKKSNVGVTENTAKYLICDDEYQKRGLSENTMKLSKRQLRRIVRKVLREGTYEKLNSDVTGDDANLDQEVFFGLSEDVLELCEKYANDPRYAQYGITVDDVLEELKNVVSDIQVS